MHLRAVWLAVISLEKNMNMKTIEDVFIHLLSDTYSAEKQLTRALAKLARATSNEKLSQAFHAHLEETHGQIERIDQVVESESGDAANLLI